MLVQGGNERGAVLVIVAVCMVALCGIIGLALDGARVYITRAELSRAVDAAALGGAGSMRLGLGTAEQRVLSLAAANGVDPARVGETLDYDFGQNAEGERTVIVTASRIVPTTFMRVLGETEVPVSSTAEATVPPLDLVFVVDQSGSIQTNGAWDDLQAAARDFVDRFDDSMDQMGLVSYQTRGTERFLLDAPFRTSIKASIDGMQSAGDTNMGEGLRLAKRQFEAGPVRERSIRVVILFTDGRPTAFRGDLGGEDRILAVCLTPCDGSPLFRGYFDHPDDLPSDRVATPDGCVRTGRCFGWNEPQAREEARQSGIIRANALRAEGIHIFAIGLGDPAADHPLLVPDDDYMRLLANVNGVADPGQPQGAYYFAPRPEDLDEVFENVAEDILVRLTL